MFLVGIIMNQCFSHSYRSTRISPLCMGKVLPWPSLVWLSTGLESISISLMKGWQAEQTGPLKSPPGFDCFFVPNWFGSFPPPIMLSQSASHHSGLQKPDFRRCAPLTKPGRFAVLSTNSCRESFLGKSLWEILGRYYTSNTCWKSILQVIKM